MAVDRKGNTEGGELRHKDRVYANLKVDIIRCKLAPGLAVSEAKLAALYEVGKAPIRDALARLCHENLVISQPRKGHVIAPITIRDVIDLYEMRMFLEPMAARMAAGKVNEGTLRRVMKACEIPFKSDNSASITQFLTANSEFHGAIARFSGNQRLGKQIAGLLEDTERVRHVIAGSGAPLLESVNDHAALVEALVAGNREEAAELAKRHVQRGWRMAMSSLLSKFQFMDQNLGSTLDGSNSDSLLQQNLSFDSGSGVDGNNVFKLINSLGDDQLVEASEMIGDGPDALTKTEENNE